MAATHPYDRARRGGAYYALVAAFLTFLAFLFPIEWLVGDDVEALDYVLAAAWLAFPVAGYLDVRGIRGMEDVDWTPKTWLWTLGFAVPIFNASAAFPYLLRRHEKVERRTSWSFWWRISAAAAAFLFLATMTALFVEDYLMMDSELVVQVFDEVIAVALLASTVLTPAAVRYDVAYVKGNYSWQPDTWLWTFGAAVWFLNIFVVLGYVAKRSPDSEYSRIDSDAADDEPEEKSMESRDSGDSGVEWGSWDDSQDDVRRESTVDEASGVDGVKPTLSVDDLESRWWYWPAFTVALSVLFVGVGSYVVYQHVVAGAGGFRLVFQWINLLILLAFVGLFSLYAIYRDAAAIKQTDSNWKPFWEGYLIAGVFLSPVVASLVYLVQRHRHLGEP